MTDKVWYAEGITPERHDSPVDGNDHLTNGNGYENGNGNENGDINSDYDFDASDVHTVNHVPITRLQRPWVNPKNSPLKDPGLARANIAATYTHPHGTTDGSWAQKHRHQTVLQQHCEYFDRDRDGILWPSDTFIGFHNLGFGLLLSTLALIIIHLNFSYPTSTTWLPDPCFRIHLANIHRTKHGSDSDTYDSQGRFRPQQFEDIFAKYADGADYLTFWTLLAQIKGQRNVSDVIGWGGACFEWGAMYLMVWPVDGRVGKEDVRRVFDGSLFHGWAAEVERKRRRGEMRRW